MRVFLMMAFGFWIAVGPAKAGENWTRFRGSDARGVAADDERLPDRWSPTENVAWKIAIPGRGWSSPIVWEGRIFVTTATTEGETEAPKKGLYYGGERPDPSDDVFHWIVQCIDLESGRTLWSKDAHQGAPFGGMHIKNSHASETPVTDGERVYAYFGNTGLFVYTMEGEPVWNRSWEPKKILVDWGTASSPVLHGDRIYILNDNLEGSFITALDKKTGDEIWKIDRDEPSSWATPFIWENPSRTEIVTTGPKLTRSYDLEGNVLWKLEKHSSLVIPSPFAAMDLLYVSSGYVNDKIKSVYAIRPGAEGNITLGESETSNASIAWSDPTGGSYNPSSLVYGDYYYTLLDRGFFTCRNAKTGAEVYGKQRISHDAHAASEFTVSPWAYNGKIFAMSEDGDTFVIKAGPEFEVLGVNSLDEFSMATPAIASGNLILRTASHLYRITNGENASADNSS